jgi:hypothetical protein
LTRLHIDEGSGKYAGLVKTSFDLSKLPSLEYLKISGDFAIVNTLDLPPSITFVSLCSIKNSTPIHRLEHLPWLRHLTIKDFCDEAINFFKSVRWPKSLTSLCVPLGARPNEARAYLPSTLRTLKVLLSHDSPMIELATLVEHQRGLTTLKVRSGLVTMNFPLPPSLTHLAICHLQMTDGKTAVDTFRNLPLSVRHFTCQSLCDAYDCGSFAATIDDLERAFKSVFPRLSLESVESLLDSANGRAKLWSPEFRDGLKQVCLQHGMDDYYWSTRPWRENGRKLDANLAACILSSTPCELVAMQEIDSRSGAGTTHFNSAVKTVLGTWPGWTTRQGVQGVVLEGIGGIG